MANQRYGLPYKGSKNFIAEWVVNCLPPNDNFYDLFCGGCSITHAALKSGKYKRFFANDIIGGLPRLFIKAAHGHIDIDYHFVTREEFFEKKEEDILIRLCYSFGTNGKDYIYGKDREDFKHAYQDAVVFKRFDALKAWGFDLTNVATQESISERYVAAKRVLRKRERNVNLITDLSRLQGLENLLHIEELQSLERLESLARFESLARLERLESLERSYHDVNIMPNSTVYCDIPYYGTSGYGMEFNHKEFYEWALSRDFPVFVSEYWMPDDFVCIAMKGKRVTFARYKNNTLKKVEKIFVQKKYAEKYKRELFL